MPSKKMRHFLFLSMFGDTSNVRSRLEISRYRVNVVATMVSYRVLLDAKAKTKCLFYDMRQLQLAL